MDAIPVAAPLIGLEARTLLQLREHRGASARVGVNVYGGGQNLNAVAAID